jgi:uncharacterized protein (TIGR03000 family)
MKMPIVPVAMTLIASWLFGVARPAAAQVMSKWGHPVVTFGWTPYDSVNTGHGNYPGSPGFIPGYGSFPGPGPDTYPWMDGPGSPFDRRNVLAPSPAGVAGDVGLVADQDQAPRDGTALIIVKLPADADLWFNEGATSQRGSYRTFVTPRLSNDRDSIYTIRVRWLIKDAELSRVERISVQPGLTTTVNFLTNENWTGHRLERLPYPQPAAK